MDLSASERQEMTEGGRWGLGRVNDARKSTWLGPILARTGCQVMHIQVPFFASISVCQGIPGVTDGQMWGLTSSLWASLSSQIHIYKCESEFEFSCLKDVT